MKEIEVKIGGKWRRLDWYSKEEAAFTAHPKPLFGRETVDMIQDIRMVGKCEHHATKCLVCGEIKGDV